MNKVVYKMDWNIIITGVLTLSSGVIVALLNNWEKLNKSKRNTKDILTKLDKLNDDIKNNHDEMLSFQDEMKLLSSAQRALLQQTILENCKIIQGKCLNNDKVCEEKLKQLIILFKEYHNCGFNSQARLYFEETLEIASSINNSIVRDLMNNYFPNYNPTKHID